jgi:hypothetical protein
MQYNWNLTKQQFNSLIEYYDTNTLLVECLNINNVISDEFKEEIKAALLLPISRQLRG